jgi:hypothetical protein
MAACDDPECLQALQALQLARNEILALCELIRQLDADIARHRALLAVYVLLELALLGTLTAIITFAPPILKEILAAVVLIAMAAVLVAIGFQLNLIAKAQQAIARAVATMNAARTAFDNAVAQVMATCDRECWASVDLDQPACPVVGK